MDAFLFHVCFYAFCAGLTPHAGAGTYFRERATLRKGLPKDTFGIRFEGTCIASITQSYFKGAPLKVSTRLICAEKQFSVFIRWRSLLERSRELAELLAAAFLKGRFRVETDSACATNGARNEILSPHYPATCVQAQPAYSSVSPMPSIMSKNSLDSLTTRIGSLKFSA